MKYIYFILENTNNSYKKVSIEIDDKLDFEELKKLLENKGETEVQLILRQKDTKFIIKLENPRKWRSKKFSPTTRNKIHLKFTPNLTRNSS